MDDKKWTNGLHTANRQIQRPGDGNFLAPLNLLKNTTEVRGTCDGGAEL